FDLLRPDLYRLARHLMAREDRNHTLQPTALLHEAWIRVSKSHAGATSSLSYELIARAMREVLIDHARGRKAIKRGKGWKRVPIDKVMDRCAEQGLLVSDVRDSLEELARREPRQATAFTLRFLADQKIEEIARALELSVADV